MAGMRNERRAVLAIGLVLALLPRCGDGGGTTDGGTTDGGGIDGDAGPADATLDVGPPLPAGGTAVTTFHSISLYWSPPSAPLGDAVKIRYRKSTEGSWRAGHDLWYDSRTGIGFQQRPVEARGSIVHCDPDTDYVVQFGMPQTDGTTTWVAELGAHTWSETFPVGATLSPWTGTQTATTSSSYLGSRSGSTRQHVLFMNQSGTATGYTLYDLTGRTAQAPNQSNQFPVVIQGSYMILRGLKTVGGEDGIFIDPGSNHIVIEDCELTAYGRDNGTTLQGGLTGEQGVQEDAGIKFPDASYGSILDTKQIVVQRNKIHNPAFGSNSWDTGHPLGPTAIMMYPTGGDNVFRDNEAYSTLDGTLDGTPDTSHFHEDGFIMGGDNTEGIGPDTDVYKNIVMHYFDDGLETDGDGTNDRVWNNYFDYGGADEVSTTSTNLGPVYIWRNVYNRVRMWYSDPWGNERDRVAAFKSGGFSSTQNGGRRYIYHNTFLQPPYASENAPGPYTLGAGQGAGGASNYAMINTVSRNNVYEIWKPNWDVFAMPDSSDDLDYDLSNANMTEAHGKSGAAQYQSGNGWLGTYPGRNNYHGKYRLQPGTPGYDDGALIPNFNDGYQGAGPDRGAAEDGAPDLTFGITASGS